MKFILTLLFIVVSANSIANSNNVTDAIEYLKTACATGETIEIESNGAAGISLFKKGIKGSVNFSYKEANGVVEGLSSLEQKENMESIRTCFKPYNDKILEIILNEQN